MKKIKGVVLCGGMGTRLRPLTEVTNKHLLAVYDKPMIFHPIETLVKAEVKEILIITGGESIGDIMRLVGSGKRFGADVTYRIQETAGGIAHALKLAEKFSAGNDIAVILGDNIFEDTPNVSSFSEGAKVFLAEVSDPERFGVAEIEGEKIISIEEKPKNPKTNYAVTGLYFYDNSVFDKINNLKSSARGELEITDVNNAYISEGKMSYSILNGYWSDAGTFDSLVKASNLLMKKREESTS